MLKKLILLFSIAAGLGIFSYHAGLNGDQAVAISIFSSSILGTLLFWEFRLSFAFLGAAVLLATRAIDLENLIRFSSLEVILFLVGMMVIIGLLKDAGFFAWIVSLIIRTRNLTAKKFVFIISVISMGLACAVDEVTSIIFIVAAILEICEYFEVEPVPYIIISVLATNIGSAGTVLGNPIGILIATKSGLTFEDFIVKAFPLAAVCLLITIAIVMFWYKRSLRQLDRQIKEFGSNEMLIKLVSVPPDRQIKAALSVFISTLLLLAFSHRLDLFLGLETNTILLIVPLVAAAFIMIWKHAKAREFIEKDVEWWTLLFFLLLFAQAGTLKYTGATDVLAKKLAVFAGHSSSALTGIVLWVSAIGSSILDNVVLVAAFVPIIQSFQGLGSNLHTLWWALLFGGCFGGNITIVGSTANIVALGILEKEKNIRLTFFRWFWIGLTVGLVTTTVVWAALSFLPFYG
ncbi:MAG: SLC13 family permease [Candidatus Omnitrophica bacterium]|nr:SLC13 family permease [Candidatus Omnitrophota bacterium]MDD5553218.1 SLC13 family permease [Candidatus Omnitrophota bacterium]